MKKFTILSITILCLMAGGLAHSEAPDQNVSLAQMQGVKVASLFGEGTASKALAGQAPALTLRAQPAKLIDSLAFTANAQAAAPSSADSIAHPGYTLGVSNRRWNGIQTASIGLLELGITLFWLGPKTMFLTLGGLGAVVAAFLIIGGIFFTYTGFKQAIEG